MVKIIDGKKLAKVINDQTVQAIVRLKEKRPNLAIILVGDNPDSALYVKNKEKTGKRVGVDTHLYKCEADLGQAKILEIIDFLNRDDLIDAIMVQLPLPAGYGYKTDEIIARISPAKDVDRFHPQNIKAVRRGQTDILPPVFAVVLEMLKSIKFSLAGKKITIIANSKIFRNSFKDLLNNVYQAQAIAGQPDESDLLSKTRQADVLVSVVGRPKFIKKEMIKPKAILIDVGITRRPDGIYGDVDLEDVKDKAKFVSPVPGGVGPMTVAITLQNVLKLYQRRRLKNQPK